MTSWHFPVFVLMSAAFYLVTLWLVFRRRPTWPPMSRVVWVGAITVVAGMTFAKVGATLGWPVAVYYGVPALAAWVLPPVAFRMSSRETLGYLVLVFMSAPTIHVLASLLLGWHEYMPFLPVPSLRELFS